MNHIPIVHVFPSLDLVGVKFLVSNVNVKLSYVVPHVSEAPLVKLESCSSFVRHFMSCIFPLGVAHEGEGNSYFRVSS